jgi:hypothetical protein
MVSFNPIVYPYLVAGVDAVTPYLHENVEVIERRGCTLRVLRDRPAISSERKTAEALNVMMETVEVRRGQRLFDLPLGHLLSNH